jgi:CheY-like chemotaxis protein
MAHLEQEIVEIFPGEARLRFSSGERPPRAGWPPSALASISERPRKAAVPRRVLVVEDSLDSVHSLVLMLRSMGHVVEYAINGYAALEIAKRFHPEYVFLDLGLPGLSGIEVCKKMRADSALTGARIIAVTAYTQPEYRERAKAAGCEGYLVKPVSPEVFESVLG